MGGWNQIPPDKGEGLAEPKVSRLLDSIGFMLAFAIILLVIAGWLRHAGVSPTLGSKLLSAFLITLAGISALTVRLSARTKGAALASVMMLLGTLYLLELSLLLLERSARRKEAEAGHDTRTKVQVVADLRRSGRMAFPSIYPAQLAELLNDDAPLLPLGGVSRALTVMCREGPLFAVYQSDERGFNNPAGLWSSPYVEVVAVGDSFVEGWCVPEESNAVAGIRRRYPYTLNLGRAGNGPLINAAVFREYVEPLQPRLVLWFYFENDLLELESEKRNPALSRYREPDYRQDLLVRQAEIDSRLSELVDSLMNKSPLRGGAAINDVFRIVGRRLIDGFTLAKTRVFLTTAFPLPQRPLHVCCDLELYQEILAETRSRTQSWGGELVFVFLPARERYQRVPLFRTTVEELAARDAVLSLVNELGIPLIDVHEAFMAFGAPLELFPDPLAHYNARGYSLVADFVLQELEKRHLMLLRP